MSLSLKLSGSLLIARRGMRLEHITVWLEI